MPSRTSDLERFARRCGLDLEPFQKRILQAVRSGVREAVILLPRGNGKTSLMALIALHHLVTVEDARVVVAATTSTPATAAAEVLSVAPSDADSVDAMRTPVTTPTPMRDPLS